MEFLSRLFDRGPKDPVDRVAAAVRSIAAGKRFPEAFRSESDKEIERKLLAAIETSNEDEYGRLLATMLTAPLLHRRQQVAKVLPEEAELAAIGFPNAFSRLLFAAFRTGWRSSRNEPLRRAIEFRDREVTAILESSLTARHLAAIGRLDDYFKNAATVFAEIGQPAARIAAILAAAASELDTRNAQLGYLRLVSMTMLGSETGARLTSLADAISAGEWSVDELDAELRASDVELADCFVDFDPTVFPRRWPESFGRDQGGVT